MQVGAGGKTGGAHIADHLTGIDIAACRNDKMGHMHIDGGKTVAMVDGNVIAHIAAIACRGNLTALGCINRRAQGRCHIHAIVHTGIAYTAYFGSMKNLQSQTIAIMSYIAPIVAVVLSALVLKESMSLLSVIGAVMILTATFLSEVNLRKNNN